MKNKKMLKTLIATLVVLGIIVLIGSVGINNKSKNVRFLNASWAYNYSDIQELTEDSDIIAYVRVEGIIDEIMNDNLPYTTFNVKVTNALLGCENNDNIPIFMTGNEEAQIIDCPLLNTDEECLIFARMNNKGTYTILSGPQGRFEYKDGKVNSLNVSNERVRKNNTSSNITVINKDAEEMSEEIKGYLELQNN